MRSTDRVRTTARCGGCGHVAEGITTSQAHLRSWGQTDRQDFHRCDECRAAVVERPLDAVLDELTAAYAC